MGGKARGIELRERMEELGREGGVESTDGEEQAFHERMNPWTRSMQRQEDVAWLESAKVHRYSPARAGRERYKKGKGA